jgi:hypothetical protein
MPGLRLYVRRRIAADGLARFRAASADTDLESGRVYRPPPSGNGVMIVVGGVTVVSWVRLTPRTVCQGLG